MEIVLFDKVEKQLAKVPKHIRIKLLAWAKAVELEGIAEVRKLPGYHDEPLKGKRTGQRSIRLSRSYRAIYEEFEEEEVNIISIEEVNKHDY